MFFWYHFWMPNGEHAAKVIMYLNDLLLSEGVAMNPSDIRQISEKLPQMDERLWGSLCETLGVDNCPSLRRMVASAYASNV